MCVMIDVDVAHCSLTCKYCSQKPGAHSVRHGITLDNMFPVAKVVDLNIEQIVPSTEHYVSPTLIV